MKNHSNILCCLFIGSLILSMLSGCGFRTSQLTEADKKFIGEISSAGNRSNNTDTRTITSIVVHHTAGKPSNNSNRVLREINRLHHRKFSKMRESRGLHISYHFLITPNGKILETRHLNDIGHHAGNWEVNKKSIAICLVGDFSKHRPTKKQVTSLDTLIKRIKQDHPVKMIIPHSHSKATLCCGEHLKREVRRFSWGRNF